MQIRAANGGLRETCGTKELQSRACDVRKHQLPRTHGSGEVGPRVGVRVESLGVVSALGHVSLTARL